MTPDQREVLIDRFRQQVQGVWLDVVLNARTPNDQTIMRLQQAQRRTDELSRALFDTIHPGETKAANGAPHQPKGAKS